MRTYLRRVLHVLFALVFSSLEGTVAHSSVMQSSLRRTVRSFFFLLFSCALVSSLFAQSNSGIVNGTVTDPSGAVVPGATVTIQNPVSGLLRSATTDSSGHFQFTNLPFNTYHLTASAHGFSPVADDTDVSSSIPVNVKVALKVAGDATTVTVDATDLLQSSANFTTPVDRGLFDKVPLESQSSTLSSLVTLATPGVAADSNGLFHGLGDHASNSFSVDGQPI
ncbi:MAG TPA: carboxypeptidase-like regulatory domain-containing protein, partial [Acidobacteriaceae bacterium]